MYVCANVRRAQHSKALGPGRRGRGRVTGGRSGLSQVRRLVSRRPEGPRAGEAARGSLGGYHPRVARLCVAVAVVIIPFPHTNIPASACVHAQARGEEDAASRKRCGARAHVGRRRARRVHMQMRP
jgi:hypothetical protein